MKLAVKIVNILYLIFEIIAIIVAIFIQEPIKELIKTACEEGNLIVNNEKVAMEDIDMVLKFVPIVTGVFIFIFACAIVLLSLNLYFLSKDNLTAILVIGIINLVVGAYVIGILDIVYHILSKDKSDYEKPNDIFYKPDEPHVNEDGKIGF